MASLDHYVEAPIQIDAVSVPVPVPVFVRYQQPADDMTAIYEWMKHDEAGFLRGFAIPHYCAWSNSASDDNRAEAEAVGLNWPVQVDDFHDLTEAKITLLKKRPYRLATLAAIRAAQHGENGVRITPIRNRREEDLIDDVIYCVATADGTPFGVPKDILGRIINSALRTFLIVPTHELRSIVIVDLYLSRVTGTNAGHYFHCDSGNVYRSPQGEGHATGHENLDYVSLMMLMEPGSYGRTTSLIAHGRLDQDVGPRNMVTLLSKMGTCIVFKDDAFFHSSPAPNILRGELGQAEIFQPGQQLQRADGSYDTVTRHVTPLNVAIANKEVLELPVPRSFVRVHFVKADDRRYPYDGDDNQADFFRDPQIPRIPSFIVEPTRLNQALNSLTGVLGRSQNYPHGLTIGGKRKGKKSKRKGKSKLRGGKLENVMISVPANKLYQIDKCKTGLTLVV